MLSPSDIRFAVESVLRATDNALSSYQILDRLPSGLRDQIIIERGLPGLGSGNSYSAASLVTDAVESILPSLEPPYRTYIDTGSTAFSVAGHTITAGNSAIAFYRLPNLGTGQTRSPNSTFSDVTHTSGNTSASRFDFATPAKSQWFEKPGILAFWFIVFWPIALLGMYYNGKAAIAAGRTPWFEKMELLVLSVVFFPVLFVGIFSSRKVSVRGKWIAAGVLALMFISSPVQQHLEEQRVQQEQIRQSQATAVAQAKAEKEEKAREEAHARYLLTPAGKAELAVEQKREAAQKVLEAKRTKSQAIAEKQREDKNRVAETRASEGMPLEVHTYLEKAANYIQEIADALIVFSTQCGLAGHDTALVTNEDWRLKTAGAAAIILAAAQQLRELSPVPDDCTSINSSFKSIGSDYEQAMNVFAQGIDSMDAAKIQESIDRVNHASQEMDDSKPALAALKAKYAQ